MPLGKHIGTEYFHRTLYGPGILQTITLWHRQDDQKEGIVTAYTVYEVRRSRIHKSGEALQADMSSDMSTIWHIPRSELVRLGISYINALDVIIDEYNRYWQPESTTTIEIKLLQNHIDIHCLRFDPLNDKLKPIV